MKSYTLKTNSWHFYLANWGGPKIYADDQMDICSYIRRVIGGLAKMILVMLLVATVVGVVVFAEGAFCYCAFLLITGVPALEVVQLKAAGPAMIAAIMNLLFLFAALANWYRNSNVQVPTPGFVTLATKKFKSKTCFMVEFKE
jgi:hypothetical protein